VRILHRQIDGSKAEGWDVVLQAPAQTFCLIHLNPIPVDGSKTIKYTFTAISPMFQVCETFRSR